MSKREQKERKGKLKAEKKSEVFGRFLVERKERKRESNRVVLDFFYYSLSSSIAEKRWRIM